jgi:hypothetical protein
MYGIDMRVFLFSRLEGVNADIVKTILNRMNSHTHFYRTRPLQNKDEIRMIQKLNDEYNTFII